jgi:hypothetical protein
MEVGGIVDLKQMVSRSCNRNADRIGFLLLHNTYLRHGLPLSAMRVNSQYHQAGKTR